MDKSMKGCKKRKSGQNAWRNGPCYSSQEWEVRALNGSSEIGCQLRDLKLPYTGTGTGVYALLRWAQWMTFAAIWCYFTVDVVFMKRWREIFWGWFEVHLWLFWHWSVWNGFSRTSIFVWEKAWSTVLLMHIESREIVRKRQNNVFYV